MWPAHLFDWVVSVWASELASSQTEWLSLPDLADWLTVMSSWAVENCINRIREELGNEETKLSDGSDLWP